MSRHPWLPEPVAEMAAWDPGATDERPTCEWCGAYVREWSAGPCGACELRVVLDERLPDPATRGGR